MAATAPDDARNKSDRRDLVASTAEALRSLIFANEDGALVGSLRELAQCLGVGLVTVQQAARVLEHEGLLEVRRGPGGGYYGRRPDVATVERALAAYMRSHPSSWEDALDITSLLFIELVAGAARCSEAALIEELEIVDRRVAAIETAEDLAQVEGALQDLLFHMVNRPLLEMITRVTIGFAATQPEAGTIAKSEALEQWKAGRHRIIAAILKHDPELASFEAERSNRRLVLERIRKLNAPPRA